MVEGVVWCNGVGSLEGLRATCDIFGGLVSPGIKKRGEFQIGMSHIEHRLGESCGIFWCIFCRFPSRLM